MSNPNENRTNENRTNERQPPRPAMPGTDRAQRIVALFVSEPVTFTGKTRLRFFLEHTPLAEAARKSVAEREQIAKSMEWFVRGQSVVITATIDGVESTEVIVLGAGDRVRLEDVAPVKA